MPNNNSVVRIYTARTGKKTCEVSGKHLHSKYKPEEEALRIVIEQQKEKQKHAQSIELVVVLGSALGYEIHAITTLYPKAKIIGIFFHHKLYNEAAHDNSYPHIVEKILYEPPMEDAGVHALQKQFAKTIGHIAVKNIVIIQWKPACRIWHESTAFVARMIKEVLEKQVAEKNTAQFFMRQWLSNTVLHYLHLEAYSIIAQKSSKPALIIGAGPTIMEQLPYIQTIRDNLIIVATSSSLACLYEYKIFPDIIVHQDSSYYASMHLAACRYMDNKAARIAMPMHASRSEVVRQVQDIVLLNSAQDMEANLPMPPCTKTAAYATVMGTAIELSWKLSENKVYIIGFDASVDVHGSHALPHSTQNAKYSGSRRAPYEGKLRMAYTKADYTLSIKRHGMPIKQTQPLRIYSRWFETWRHVHKARTYMLVPNTNDYVLSGFAASTHIHRDALQCAKSDVVYKRIKRESYERRRKTIVKCLQCWRDAVEKKLSPVPLHIQNTLGILEPEKAREMIQMLEHHVA